MTKLKRLKFPTNSGNLAVYGCLLVAAALARLHGVTVDAIAAATTATARQCFPKLVSDAAKQD